MAADDHDARLANELGIAGYSREVTEKARNGHWSDFRSPLAAPKMDLVGMLERDGHRELARRVKEGEFDG